MKLKHAVVMALGVAFLAFGKSAQGQSVVAKPQVQPPMSVGQMLTVQTGSFYVSMKGLKQGQFKVETPATSQHTGTIAGIRFSYQLSAPIAPATGLPAGKRQYSPITFTKLWGPASPQILQACSTNEVVTVTFEFDHQKITLTGATISSVRRYVAVPSGNDAPDPRELEDVSITFQSISVVDAAGAATMDSWAANT
jgi:type VI secretion system Hcp family effector